MRIAVTGVGAVTPHADTVAASWKAILRGDRAVRSICAADLGYSEFGGQPGWGPWHGAPAIVRRRLGIDSEDPVVTLARRAVREAVEQSRLTTSGIDPSRVGCVFGTSKGGLDSFQRYMRPRASRLSAENHRSTTDNLWSMLPPNVPTALLSSEYGWQGPAIAPIAACATGLVSLIRGAALLRDGDCDVVVTGSSDASLQPAVLASFRRLGVMAPAAADPARACRPFDTDRSGFAIGEGAGAVILERWEHAVARGVPILAEWVDGLQRGDPFGITMLPAEPTALVRLIEDLLRRSGLAPSELDAVSLHGTGTRINDAYEAAALRLACGVHLEKVTAFGLKGGIGHLLGGAGSVETVAAICAIGEQQLPPTVNCDDLAADCPIPVTAQGAVARPVEHLLKLSLGFGGHLAAGLLRHNPRDLALPIFPIHPKPFDSL